MEGEEKAGSGAEVDGVQRGRTRDLGSHPAGVPRIRVRHVSM